MDQDLSVFDVLASIAHTQMLSEVGLLTSKEGETLIMALREIHKIIKSGQFKIEDGIEDVHAQIEYNLTQSLGILGKKIHSGRSRNDQVLTHLKCIFAKLYGK